MTGGADQIRPQNGNVAQSAGSGSEPAWLPGFRHVLSASAVILLVVVLVPPLNGWARAHEWVEAIQFAALGVGVPALLTMGAPWGMIGLGSFARRVADCRRRHPEVARSAAFAVAELCGFVGWRTPAAVDWLTGGAWRVLVEAAVLLVVGVGFWLELVESPPLSPRSIRPLRMAIAASGMWTIWVLAYLVGLSHDNWYRAYHHVAGSGLSLAADQQVTTGLLWAAAACAFVPVIFWNLVVWLRSEEDPDEELHRLAKQERRRSSWQPSRGRGGTVPPRV